MLLELGDLADIYIDATEYQSVSVAWLRLRYLV